MLELHKDTFGPAPIVDDEHIQLPKGKIISRRTGKVKRSMPPIGPRRAPNVHDSISSAISSPGTALTTTTSLSGLIVEGVKRGAMDAVRNQAFPSGIAKGMISKIITREIDEVASAAGSASKFLSVLGDYGSPAIDVISGIYNLEQDKLNYSGSDLNRAQAVTYVSTIASVGAGVALIGATSSIIAGLAVGIALAATINVVTDYVKYLVTKDL